MARRVFALAALFLSVLGATRRADADAGSLPQAAHRYALGATLDAVHHRVLGEAQIHFTNTSDAPLEALLFHLYMNAFLDDRSVFMRESGGLLRTERARGAGGITLEQLTIDGDDALARAEPELVPGDRTQLRVPLTTPLAPGASLAIATKFVVRLPPLFARAGYEGDFHAVAQWFPKLAKLEPDGRFAGFPYHGLGEFYADFADYTLEVEVPHGMQVVASGDLVDEQPRGAHTVRRFSARHVHDVAFFAARGYREDVTRAGDVVLRTFAPPGYEAATAEHARLAKAGIAQFGRAFGPYPYGSLTLVLPPRGGDGAAGMEYPTLVASEGGWLASARLPSLTGPFVTAHELAHQWFYGLIATDEVHHPVLDEGLTQWASLDLMRRVYGAQEGIGPLALERFDVTRLALRLMPTTAPGLPAYAYALSEYGASVYARAALALESIRRAHGRERFDRALASYAARERFRHPTPADLERAFDEAYGAGFAAEVVRPLLFDGLAASVHLTRARTGRSGRGYVTRVRARRSGVPLPTWLALYDAQGRELRRTPFRATDDALDVALETDVPVARVVLDPDRALLLDDRVSDQTMQFTQRDGQTVIAQAVALAQLLLAWAGP